MGVLPAIVKIGHRTMSKQNGYFRKKKTFPRMPGTKFYGICITRANSTRINLILHPFSEPQKKLILTRRGYREHYFLDFSFERHLPFWNFSAFVCNEIIRKFPHFMHPLYLWNFFSKPTTSSRFFIIVRIFYLFLWRNDLESLLSWQRTKIAVVLCDIVASLPPPL